MNVQFLLTKLLSLTNNAFKGKAKILTHGGLALGVFVASALPSVAHMRQAPKPIYIAGHNEAVVLSVSQHELALSQVFYEICPNLLNQDKKDEFYRAYDDMLQGFIPKAEDPNEILRRLSSQQEYRKLLQKTRAWTTKNFSTQENQAVCERFAQDSKFF